LKVTKTQLIDQFSSKEFRIWQNLFIKLLTEWQTMNFFTVISFGMSFLGFLIGCLLPNSFIM